MKACVTSTLAVCFGRAGILHARENADPRRRRAHGETADRPHRSRRVDRTTTTKSREGFARAALKAAGECDAILMSDYGTGLVTPALAAALSRKVAARTRRRPVPILVDSRYDLLRYRGLTACTPNESEVEQILGVKIGDNLRGARAGRPRAAEAHAHERRARHAREPRHGAVRSRPADRFTCRFTDRTKWPTSPAPATPSSRR